MQRPTRGWALVAGESTRPVDEDAWHFCRYYMAGAALPRPVGVVVLVPAVQDPPRPGEPPDVPRLTGAVSPADGATREAEQARQLGPARFTAELGSISQLTPRLSNDRVFVVQI